MAAILQRRIAPALDDNDNRAPDGDRAPDGVRGRDGVELRDVLADAALVTLFDYYAARPSDVRRNLLLVMQAALTLAVDDPDAGRIDRRHVELAIAEGTG